MIQTGVDLQGAERSLGNPVDRTTVMLASTQAVRTRVRGVASIPQRTDSEGDVYESKNFLEGTLYGWPSHKEGSEGKTPTEGPLSVRVQRAAYVSCVLGPE